MAATLRDQRVSAFPVIDDGNKVIGVVSEADLLAKEAFAGDVPGILHQRENARVNGLTAADLMTRPAVTIGPGEPVSGAARLMYSRRVKRLPVVAADGTLVGIVSRADVLAVYDRPDGEIRREITEDLITPETATVARDIIGAARHVEGVVAVRDRLSRPPAAPHRSRALI